MTLRNRVCSRAAEIFHNIGRWFELKALMLGGQSLFSHDGDTRPPIMYGDMGKIRINPKDPELADALAKGYAKAQEPKRVPRKQNCASMKWTGENWNSGNKSYNEEDGDNQVR